MSGKHHDFHGFSFRKRKAPHGVRQFFQKGRSIMRGSFFKTKSDVSINSTPAIPSTRHAGDHSESNANARGCASLDGDSLSLIIGDLGEYDNPSATDSVTHRRSQRTLPFQTMNLFKNPFKGKRKSNIDSIDTNSEHRQENSKRSTGSLISNENDVSTKSRKGRSRKKRTKNDLSEHSDHSFSSWKSGWKKFTRSRSNVSEGEYFSDDSLDSLDMSFQILTNIDEDLDTNGAHRRESLGVSDNMGLLAVSRTPSFNTMLHANHFYSDSCTLVKCKSVRITWEDLSNNTKQLMKELMEEEEEENDEVSDLLSSVSLNRRSFTSEHRETSEIFGVRNMRSRGSFLVQKPTKRRSGPNLGGVPLWSGTSTIEISDQFSSFIVFEKTKEWLKHLKTCDPRYRILNFFNDVANEGATGDSENFSRDHVSPLLKHFNRASVFTVWRPTSLQSIRRMMLGEGVGKGLDIKGKSAKRGKLSAFVPFMQIFKEEHKAKIRTLRKNGRIRIFFNSKKDRDLVMDNLNEIAIELGKIVRDAKKVIEEKEKHDDETFESALQKMILDMDDTTIDIIDTYTDTDKYGIEVQERLFWEGMVMRQDIYRKPASADDIGRSSLPSFQDMNFDSLRKPMNDIPHTRAVIMQYNPPREENNNPMSPLNLLMAYEENDPAIDRRRVIPVVSDFDCFIVGTRGVKYHEEVPVDQINVLKWMVEQTETILDTPTSESWTKRWLDVLKDSGNKGFYPKIPSGGYADPKTRFIFKHAINRLSKTGAVRHGAECFNYHFPQELDDELLVISDELPDGYNACNWTYVDHEQLKEILMYKIDNGYTFPLNPKWVLCDEGWKEVYDKAMASNKPNVQDSMRSFYPPQSGLRELIEKIYKKHPGGFKRVEDRIEQMRKDFRIHGRSARLSNIEDTYSHDLALYQLKNYMILQRAKRKMKGFILMNSVLKSIRNVSNSQTETKSEFKTLKLDQRGEIIEKDVSESLSGVKFETEEDKDLQQKISIDEGDRNGNQTEKETVIEGDQGMKQKETMNGNDGGRRHTETETGTNEDEDLDRKD